MERWTESYTRLKRVYEVLEPWLLTKAHLRCVSSILAMMRDTGTRRSLIACWMQSHGFATVVRR
jgi:hypothetical protein